MNNIEKIFTILNATIQNEIGTAALMGNLKAESNLEPTNLQNIYNKSLNMTDAEYTEKVDNGTYSRFINDSAGYGLAQWTYWSRKRNLLAYAKNMKASIGDLEMQCNFLLFELANNYDYVFKILKTAVNLKEASDIVLKYYENPAVQNDYVKEKRAAYGKEILNQIRNASSTVSSTAAEELLYKVQKGDCLSIIAQKFNTTVEDIIKLNPDKIKDPDKIRTGWIIKIK